MRFLVNLGQVLVSVARRVLDRHDPVDENGKSQSRGKRNTPYWRLTSKDRAKAGAKGSSGSCRFEIEGAEFFSELVLLCVESLSFSR